MAKNSGELGIPVGYIIEGDWDALPRGVGQEARSTLLEIIQVELAKRNNRQIRTTEPSVFGIRRALSVYAEPPFHDGVEAAAIGAVIAQDWELAVLGLQGQGQPPIDPSKLDHFVPIRPPWADGPFVVVDPQGFPPPPVE